MDANPVPLAKAKVCALGLLNKTYTVEWWDTLEGKPVKKEEVTAKDGRLPLSPPPFQVDIAAQIKAN